MGREIIDVILKGVAKTQDVSKLNNLWQGYGCFVIGGGPSIKGFDFNRLNSDWTIGCNELICFYYPHIWFSLDTFFYKRVMAGDYGKKFLDRWKAYEGIKIWALNNETAKESNLDDSNIRILGIDDGWGGITYPNKLPTRLEKGIVNAVLTGFGALQIAYCMGANPIYLLGFDGGQGNGKFHFYKEFLPVPAEKADELYNAGIQPFEWFAKMLEIENQLTKKPVIVYNCSKNSKIKCFPYKNIREILR